MLLDLFCSLLECLRRLCIGDCLSKWTRSWSFFCLWTRFLQLEPSEVHLDYLEARADIILTAQRFSIEESEVMLKKSVEIAHKARDIYYEICSKSSSNDTEDNRILKHRPILVEAFVGSYGAYLADGFEYSGIYGDDITLEVLKYFHRRRVQVLAEANPDLIPFETIPNKLEFAFNSKDGVNVVIGDSILECSSIAKSRKKFVGIGINCTPPRFIHGLISSIAKVTTKPILKYLEIGFQIKYFGNTYKDLNLELVV
ncbi:hypothetical protein UlMin_024009 [Ulmus minor]